MKYKAFPTAKDGEWIQPKMRGYLMSCCDCGLIHRMDFRIAWNKKETEVRGKFPVVQFRAYRSLKWTKIMRVTRAKRSGSNCICGAIVRSHRRKKLNRKTIRQVSRKGARHG